MANPFERFNSSTPARGSRSKEADQMSLGVAKGNTGRKAMQGVLDDYFLPDYFKQKQRSGAIEEAFMPTLDPETGLDFVQRGGEKIIADVFRPGGMATEAIRRARGGAIQTGFGTSGGDLSSQENRASMDAINSTFGAYMGQAMPGLYEGAAGRATQAYGISQNLEWDKLQSLFTGQGGVEQLGMAEKDDSGWKNWAQRNIPFIGDLF